jgi:hypothetical protein
MALWIDTLCIPVDPSLRKYRDQAIVLLKNTYSDARAVLVLDRDLQQASRHSSTLELGIRVLCSGWMRRLWTLQEASLVSKQEPWKLNFQFLEGPLAHTELDPSLETIYGEETYNPVRTVEEMVLLYEGLISAIRIRIPPTHDLQQESERKTRFTVIADAVAYRSTSKPRDEPVCMAGLMGLDVAAILELKTAEERMILFYMMLGEVPADIIFVRGMAKLKTAPFRWAPASILTSEFASPQYRWKPVGTCNMDGLYVAYKGFIFVDAAATNKRLETRCVIQDSETGEEYLVNKSWEGTSETFILPEQPALIFQWETHNRNTPTAVVNIETYTVNEHGQEWPANICFRVKVVHHVSISPIESVDTTGDDSLEYFAGKVTESGQIWNIT